MEVKALRLGFYGGSLRNEGDVFDVKSKSEIGSWMKPLGVKKQESKQPQKQTKQQP